MKIKIRAGIAMETIDGTGVDLQADRIEIDLGPHNKVVISQEDDDGLTFRSWHGALAIHPQAANSARISVET